MAASRIGTPSRTLATTLLWQRCWPRQLRSTRPEAICGAGGGRGNQPVAAAASACWHDPAHSLTGLVGAAAHILAQRMCAGVGREVCRADVAVSRARRPRLLCRERGRSWGQPRRSPRGSLVPPVIVGRHASGACPPRRAGHRRVHVGEQAPETDSTHARRPQVRKSPRRAPGGRGGWRRPLPPPSAANPSDPSRPSEHACGCCRLRPTAAEQSAAVSASTNGEPTHAYSM